MIAEKYEGEYDIYHAKSCAGDIAAQLGAEPLGEKGWTDEQIVEANPEAIFSVHVSSVTDEEAVNLFLDNPALASVDAVIRPGLYARCPHGPDGEDVPEGPVRNRGMKAPGRAAETDAPGTSVRVRLL